MGREDSRRPTRDPRLPLAQRCVHNPRCPAYSVRLALTSGFLVRTKCEPPTATSMLLRRAACLPTRSRARPRVFLTCCCTTSARYPPAMDAPAPAAGGAASAPAAAAPGPAEWEAFRETGKAMVDAIADYYGSLARGERPVKPVGVSPGYLRPLLPSAAPEEPRSFSDVMADVNSAILPGVTHWQHPSFFAFFPANTSPPAMLGDMLSHALGVIGFSWAASPACTELETVVLDWLAGLCDVGPKWRSDGTGGGVIQGTASEATLVALLAAKARAVARAKADAGASSSGGAPLDAGALTGRFVVYASDQAHSSVQKAVMVAGLQPAQFVTLPASPASGYALDPAALAAAMDADVAAGRVPLLVVASSGTTSSGAFDPLADVAAVAARHGAWVHVDAAWAGSALVCPEYRHLLAGLDAADSWAFNPHKWLRTTFDCCAMYVGERRWLIDALSVTPEYLRSPEYDRGLVTDYRDWQIPLGRRFRSLKLFFVLQMYGAKVLREGVRAHVALAARFADAVATDARFELPTPPSLALVCFRLTEAAACGGEAAAGALSPDERLARANAANTALLDAVNASGQAFLVHTKLSGRVVLRLAVGSPLTQAAHVDAAWALLRAAADGVLAAGKA